MNEPSSIAFDQYLKNFLDRINTSLAVFTAISALLTVFLPERTAKEITGGIAITFLFILGYRFYKFRKSFRQPAINLVDLSNAALRGLLPFEEGEKLFGRDLDVMKVMPILLSGEFRYGVISGDSGCGKTSLVRAGVLPQLRKHNFIPLYIFSPTKDPHDAVITEIKNKYPDLEKKHNNSNGILDQLVKRENKKVVIIFDQFEEFFILNVSQEKRKLFATWLSKIIYNKNSQIDFLLIIRRDFFGELHDFYPNVYEPTPAKYCYRLHNFDHEQSKKVSSYNK